MGSPEVRPETTDGAAPEAPEPGRVGPHPGEQSGASPPEVDPPSTDVVERLLHRLEGICGAEHVITHPHQLGTYQSDGLVQYKAMPRAAVLPGTGEEVRDVIRACHEAEVPWVGGGVGSGLSGGALPIEEGILVVLVRLRRILEVDLDNQTVVCEPGVTNIAVSQAVGPSHFFPPDPSGQVVCTIGGMVAENSGAAHCFKYGFTTNYVVGLEVVLPDGEVVRLGGKQAGLPGYDLVGAFVGSEGTLGVATKITLRVVPTPETTRTLLAFFDTTAGAGGVVSEIVSRGVIPAALEMMDRLCIRACEEMTQVGFPLDAGAALLVELEGAETDCQARFDDVQEICERHGAFEVRVARDELERELMWRMRRSVFPAMGRIRPHYYVQDGVIPRTKLSEVLTRIEELSSEQGLEVANVVHAGDGNLHPLVCYDGHSEGEAERAERLAGMIVLACVEAGGSITGEPGIGVDKQRSMPGMFSEDDLAAFEKLRYAFDPYGRANPGNVMPTPRLCGEVPGPYRRHPLEVAGLSERL
jgi:glycolate oxidase